MTMNRIAVTCLIALGAANAAAEEVDKTLDAAADGLVEVSNVSGSVEIRGWSRKQVEVKGDLGRDVDELIFERDGNHVTIRVEAKHRNMRNISSDLVIRVPEKSAVRVGTVSADITVRDVLGEQTLNTVSGDIDIEGAEGDLDIQTVSGDVDVSANGTAVDSRFETVSGDIDVEKLAGDVNATTVSGDINLLNGNFGRARINTTNGDMTFRSALAEDGRLDIDTINGEVDIRFRGKVSARFDIETFNGDINNCFGPEPVRTSKYTPGRELNFTEGGGKGRVTIHTLNGDLELCKD